MSSLDLPPFARLTPLSGVGSALLAPLEAFAGRLAAAALHVRILFVRTPALIPGLLVFPLGVALGWVASAPPTSRHRLPDDLTQLRRAIAEAHENCLVATLVDADLGPSRRPLFPTLELRRALETPLLVDAAYGELPALRREARWLATLTPESDLGVRSWEDTRFLLGAIHWYLDQALASSDAGAPSPGAHAFGPADCDPAALRVYRGLDYDDLLGLWD